MLTLLPDPEALWEIRSPGTLGLVGTEHLTITLDPTSAYLYTVCYKGQPVASGRHAVLADAKKAAMIWPALLQDFGMEA